jgi:predicted phosphodiesterase
MPTRTAVFSDIHGNCVALNAVLADIASANVDQTVCLGDAIQGGPQPTETVERLRALGCPIVMGNADDWLLTAKNTGSEAVTEKQIAVREWQLSRLSEADRAFIATFQPTVELPLDDGRTLLCFHGSPTSFNDVILPDMPNDDFKAMLGPYAGRALCGGHTHMQQVRRLGPLFFFNPGSVGVAVDQYQPEDAFYLDLWAEYAILTSNGPRISLDFRRIPFDVEALAAAYRANGRPHADSNIAMYRRPKG